MSVSDASSPQASSSSSSTSTASSPAGSSLVSSVVITPPPTPPHAQPWTKVAQDKQRIRHALLDRHPQWRPDPHLVSPQLVDATPLLYTALSEREVRIVHSDATELTSRIRGGEYSAVEVLTAFVKVTVAAQDTTNCVTEIFFDEGFARAKQLDDHLARTGEVVGPLHGLPVSIKDHILVNGHDTSTGYIAWCNETKATKDAVVVDILRKAGAVLYVKTANPQTLLCLETNNNIYGRTLNPFNRNLSPGGSSGGESALIAAHGSPLGVGTDIGGSIRVPAAFTGLYGFKPSVARMPHAGLYGSHDGMDNIVGVVGPLATSARDLELFCKTMCQYESWLLEHAVLEMPWRSDVVERKAQEKLCFAILWDDGVCLPHPPLTREMERTKRALVKAGHEVIDWVPLGHQEGWDLIAKLYLLDGGKEYRDTLASSGEPAVPGTEWILAFSPDQKSYTVPETWKLNIQREQFRAAALQHWNATAKRTSTGRPVDGIICPTHASLAVPHDGVKWWGYSSHWNLLDLPGVVFPSGGRLRSEEFADRTTLGREPRNPVEKDVWAQWEEGGSHGRTFEGAPITLQLVGRRHNEEKVLGMLAAVERALKPQ